MRALWLLVGAAVLAGCEVQETASARDGATERGVERPRRRRILAGRLLQPQPSPSPSPSPSPEPSPSPTAEPGPTPGPTPLADCGIVTDAEGFFTRVLFDGTLYVGFVPPRYADAPLPLVVGLHGCGDDAWSFAEWAVNPDDTRGEQEHIGISVENESGGGCWSSAEAPRVLAAIEDVARCVHVDRNRVFVGGYSSGGELAYVLGLRHSELFAGILAENTSLRRAGDPDDLISEAAWPIPIAHVAHLDDGSYPIEGVREDWAQLRAAGFPLETAELEGGHDGETDDWIWLLSQIEDWRGRYADEEEPDGGAPEGEPEAEDGGSAGAE